MLLNIWHAGPGVRPPGGGLTGAIALRFIVPLRAPYANRHARPMALIGIATGISQGFVTLHCVLSRVGFPLRSLRCDARERTAFPNESLKDSFFRWELCCPTGKVWQSDRLEMGIGVNTFPEPANNFNRQIAHMHLQSI